MVYILVVVEMCIHYSSNGWGSYLCTRVGGCGNVYPYTVTDDRVGRNKKRKDDGKEFFQTRLC
jgi:hypothetical protein